MSTRKRTRKVDDELANTQHIQSKISRKKRTTHTNTHTVDTDEHKIDSNAETMNSDENELASSSTDRANDDSSERNENSSSPVNVFDESSTENLLREMDVLMARAAECRRQAESETSQNDSQATIIISETTDAAHPINEHNDSSDISNVASTSSANNSHTNNAIDDSVVIIDDTTGGAVRPKQDDEDVIFVTESRGAERYRTIATIDLCDTPDTSFTRPKDAGQSTSAAGQSTSSNTNTQSPQHAGKTKCPICLETFGFDQILSTMCGHLYCEPCIRNVIKIRKKCPMCNRGLKQNQVHRIFLDT